MAASKVLIEGYLDKLGEWSTLYLVLQVRD
jgi:hypothetical protein